MPIKYFMISNRILQAGNLENTRGPLSFWLTESDNVSTLASWTPVDADSFKEAVLRATESFPVLPPRQSEDQKHVTLFIHGYNNTWQSAALHYKSIVSNLFTGDSSMGICILFTWPSDGAYLGYYPDQLQARETAPDLSAVLNEFYDWLLAKQKAAMRHPDDACRAKTSIIAHSMGNYVLQKAMQLTWTRQNQPLLVSLVNQLLMVAADVDNDLFKSIQGNNNTDGDAIANLTYRVTALYTGRDPVLGLSAGLKHFGKRRLGRSGIDRTCPIPDNIWDVDCSALIPANAIDIHSEYFESTSPETVELMREVLKGVDRKVLTQEVPPAPPVVVA
jgi:esterase/lipase superfamily enzyme